MSLRYKSIVIGLGDIGLNYDYAREDLVKTHVRALLRNNNFTLIAGIDPNEAQGSKFLKVASEAEYYRSLDDYLSVNESELDLIILATPTHIREEMLTKLIASGVKSKVLLLEKPLAYELDEGLRAIEYAQNVADDVYVNYIRRCDPAYRKLKSIITEGTLGEFRSGDCEYSGGLLNMGSHYIDLCYFLFDEKYDVIDIVSREDIGKDIVANFTIQNSKGCRIVFTGKGEGLTLYLEFSKGTVKIEENGNSVKIIMNEKVNTLETRLDVYQKNVLNEIVMSLIGKNEGKILGNGIATMRLCHSVRSGKI